MTSFSKKPKVLFEVYVITHYHVPFLIKLAEETDLLVVASENTEVDGVKDITDNLPFKTIRLREEPKSDLFHPDILKVIENHQTEVYISISSVLDSMLSNNSIHKKLKSLGVKILWTGCDGYAIRHFWTDLILHLFYPPSTIRTVRKLIAKSRIDYFLSYSSHTIAYLNKGNFVPKNKILIAPNAIDTSEIILCVKKLRDQGVQRERNKIVFVGRLTRRKQPVLLVEAFSHIVKKYTDARLDIIGEGSERENLENKINELGLKKQVRLVGPSYTDSNLAEYLTRASLFVMPGLGGLGFNTAMAAGLPIIYTHADGTEKDIFTEGVNGWFFDGSVDDLSHKIDRALSNPQKLVTMGTYSVDLIKNKFNIQNMLEAYLIAISKVIEKHV